jgi:uncharacterized protein
MFQQPSPAQPEPLKRAFHVMPKPIGPLCNLDCTYCYYLPKANLLPEMAGGPIPDDLLENFIRRYIAAQEVDSVVFTWHGGEPTLLGLDFFHKVVRLQQKHAAGKRIENDLQTNGLLLDGAWCDFLRQNRFLVGLSIDGPKHLHDQFRKSKTGQCTFDQVVAAVDLLRRYNVFFNTLTIVHAGNARHGEEVYRFLTEELDSRWVQWLPCVERKDYRTIAPGCWDPTTMPTVGSAEARPGNVGLVVTDWSVDPDDWGEFLCQAFDWWIKNDLGKVTVNWFESLVGQWMGLPAQLCYLAEVCGNGLAIEKDGSLYSCERLKIGPLPSATFSNTFERFRPDQLSVAIEAQEHPLHALRVDVTGFRVDRHAGPAHAAVGHVGVEHVESVMPERAAVGQAHGEHLLLFHDAFAVEIDGKHPSVNDGRC